MNFLIRVPLRATPQQHARLCELRSVFAQVCNELAPQVQQSKVWNRVALHHLHYRSLRAQFPNLGSQMVCNAIYAVSKMARLVYQHPSSPYSLARRPAQALPLLKFADNCPVYFDRHTLSIKQGHLSLYTMDGRMRFELVLDNEKMALFAKLKLREIVLSERLDQCFELTFFMSAQEASDMTAGSTPEVEGSDPECRSASSIPEYVSVEIAS